MVRLYFIVLIAGLFNTGCEERRKEENKDLATTASRFHVGQVWKYKNRTGEDSSTLTILKIEKYEKSDTIIHIRVEGVKLYSPNAENGYSEFIGHMPFSEESISKSVTRLVGQNDKLPDFSEGYNHWKEAWDNGKGGYWTIDLKEAINSMDSVMRKGKK